MTFLNVQNRTDRTVVIGAGMAGLAAAISLSAAGREVVLLERAASPGGKMRTISSPLGGIDSGPTVFTMKYVFDELFAKAGLEFSSELVLKKADILARHAWDDAGIFDLFADREQASEAVADFFGSENAAGYERFCTDGARVFNYLKDTFIGAQRPSPIGLGRRVGLTNLSALWQLQPFTSLMGRLEKYFPDPRLRQLFGRYATYVGSSPYEAPATLMLIAHVEQEGVWLIDGGMHALARKMAEVAQSCGTDIRYSTDVSKLMLNNGRIAGVLTGEDEIIPANRVIHCGDVSALVGGMLEGETRLDAKPVAPEKRSLSAITWSVEAETDGFPLLRHNVFFSHNYRAEFDAILKQESVPQNPTVYVCAQDRGDEPIAPDASERLLLLINAPANGDTNPHPESSTERCQNNMIQTLARCGLRPNLRSATVTTPSHFNQLFPGTGGALYGRASHGWMASFARPGAKTKVPGLYLAGGSVHPGPGVPMAARSGILAAEQIMKDHVLT